MKTLYLHIGTYKTGTSAIQASCVVNRATLERHGFCFPHWPDQTEAYHNARFFVRCIEAAHDNDCSPAQTECWQSHMQAVEDIFNTYPNIILSNEGIWKKLAELPADEAEQFLRDLKQESESKGYAIKFIVYLRRQDQYFSSYWSERIKWYNPEDSTIAWPEYLASVKAQCRYDYCSTLQRIARVMGRENILLRIYERERFVNGDIVEDFFSTLGLRLDDGFVRQTGDVNYSLSANMTEIKRLINTLPGVIDDSPYLFKKIAYDCSALPAEQRKWSMFTREEQAEFLALCEPSNRRIAQEYFGTDEPLFSPPGPLPPHWTPDNPDMYASIVRYFGAVIFEQQREIEKLREDVTSKFFLKKKLKTLPGRIARKFRKLLKK